MLKNKLFAKNLILSLKNLMNVLDCQMNLLLIRRCQMVINLDVADANLLKKHLLQCPGKKTID